jgi:Dockerin type I domain
MKIILRKQKSAAITLQSKNVLALNKNAFALENKAPALRNNGSAWSKNTLALNKNTFALENKAPALRNNGSAWSKNTLALNKNTFALNGNVFARIRNAFAIRNVFALVSALTLVLGFAHAQQKLPPDYDKKREAIRNFEFGVVPLYVLGDLNEDGAVDQDDLKLLRAYVSQKNSAGISCMAAADLDENRSVDIRDIEILEQILRPGKVAAPALSSRSRLGCDYKNFFIAARPQAPAGGTVPIHFLDPRFNARNSNVTVLSGPATVSHEGDTFIVHVPGNVPENSTVTLTITLPGPRKYFYTFRIPPAPPSR